MYTGSSGKLLAANPGLNALFFKEYFYLIIISQGTDNIGIDGSNARDDDIRLLSNADTVIMAR